MKLKKGFALFTKEKLLEATRKGGKRAHELGVAHRWTSEEARIAGRKGGSSPKRIAESHTTLEEAKEYGRQGGVLSSIKRRIQKSV